MFYFVFTIMIINILNICLKIGYVPYMILLYIQNVYNMIKW